MVVKDQATKDRFTLAAMYSLSTGITTVDCSLDNSDWETIQKFAVVLSGPHDEGPYCRKDLLEPMTTVIGKVISHKLSFGPCGKNSEWWLPFKDTESHDNMLLGGYIKVREVYFPYKVGCKVSVRGAGPLVHTVYVKLSK